VQQSGVNNGSVSQQQMQREADLSQAENSDRYRDVGQIVDVMGSHTKSARQYLDYLFQYDADPTAIQQISDMFKQIDASMAGIQNSVRQEEADKIRTASAEASKSKVSDADRYNQAVQVYSSGNYLKARAMFASLSRYAVDKTVRAYSKSNFDAIVQWENEQQSAATK
jgi:TolA-binding protein